MHSWTPAPACKFNGLESRQHAHGPNGRIFVMASRAIRIYVLDSKQTKVTPCQTAGGASEQREF